MAWFLELCRQSEQNRNQFLPLAPEKESLSVPLYTASSSFKNSWLYQAGRHSAEYCSWSLHYLRMTEESKVKRYCKMRQYVLINLKGPHQQTSGQPWCRTRTPLWQPGTLSTCLEQIPPFNTPGLQRGWAEVLVDSRVSGNSTHLPPSILALAEIHPLTTKVMQGGRNWTRFIKRSCPHQAAISLPLQPFNPIWPGDQVVRWSGCPTCIQLLEAHCSDSDADGQDGIPLAAADGNHLQEVSSHQQTSSS